MGCGASAKQKYTAETGSEAPKPQPEATKPAADPAPKAEAKPAAAAPAAEEKPPPAKEAPKAAEPGKAAAALLPGLGDEPYPGFPADTCPPELPNISLHYSVMTDVLQKSPEIYTKLKDKKTPGGVTFASCIKTGMDNPGHPMIKTVGMVAGDEASYETFKELFDRVIEIRHGGYGPDAKQPTDIDVSKISDTDIDPFNKYVLTTRVRTGRSIRPFLLPPVISKEDRRKLEAVAVKALLNMKDDLKGDYFPLHGSQSYAAKPGGMPEAKEEELRKTGNLFQEPDSTLLLSSGMGRHWPDARGIFHNDAANLFVWLNEEDHLRIVSMQGSRDGPTPEGKNIKEVFTRFIRACNAVQEVLKAEGYDFMHNDHLGWVLTCPSNLGTGLRAGTMVNLPLMSKRGDWKSVLKALGLQARGTGGVDSVASDAGTWDISNADRIGKGEVQFCNTLIEGAAKLVRWENALETGKTEEVDKEIKALVGDNKDEAPAPASKPTDAAASAATASTSAGGAGEFAPSHSAAPGATDGKRLSAATVLPGLGNDEYPGFPADKCPDEIPDLKKHYSVMADVLKKNPDIYATLKDKVTPNGVTFAKCIKTGIDNPGHPMIKTVGMVAGDEECYEVFKELFDPVIGIRHGGYAADAKHPMDMDISKLSSTDVDPTGAYVVSTRVRTGRSIKGIRLPPSCTKEERREVERVMTKALLGLEGELKGDYYPLAGSSSYRPKPGGMSREDEEAMRADHFLFQEPDSTLLLSSGMGRHWPDGRGIFASEAKNFLVWTNEEDHTRIISMQMGANIKEVFTRFCTACNAVQDVVKQAGYDFSLSEHLGYILVCPSNLGTGLRASMMIKLKNLSTRMDFKKICKALKLQARGGSGVDSAGGEQWDLSNSDRLGTSEVDLVNIMIEGCAKIVEMERRLENGEEIDELIPAGVN